MQAQQARKRVGRARGEIDAVPRRSRRAERTRLAEQMSLSSTTRVFVKNSTRARTCVDSRLIITETISIKK
jgi:hypothetical protein